MEAVITIRQDVLPVLKSGLELKQRALRLSLDRYRARLRDFEDRHCMTSEQFSVAFAAGELGDEADWFEWEYILDAYRETRRQLDLLHSLQI